MKTLEQHNKDTIRSWPKNLGCGASCDKCKTEMEFTGIMLTSMPPKSQVRCPACGYVGAMK